ncbi:hypothetical protein [Nocardia sp. Marseille-Q1738]
MPEFAAGGPIAASDVLTARIVIERHLDKNGDRITATAEDNRGEPLDYVTTLGLLEFAKAQFLGMEP